MIREQKSRRIFVHIGLVIGLSICVILVFLFSIKGLLLSESKQCLSELNTNGKKILEENFELVSLEQNQEMLVLKDNNDKNYFNHEVYSYIINDTNQIIGVFSDSAKDILNDNNQSLGDFLKGQDKVVVSQRLLEDGSQVVQYNMPNGKAVYAAIDQVNPVMNGLIITIVSKELVMKEINSIYRIAIIIVILAIVVIILALIYNFHKKRSAIWKQKKSGKPDQITGLIQYSIHKAIAQKYINAEIYRYAYVSFDIDKYTLISELNGKGYCDYLLKGVAKIVSDHIQENETFARIQEDVFGMLLIYDDELRFRQRLIRILKHAGEIPMVGNNFCNITFHSGVCIVGKETDIDRIISRSRKARMGMGIQTIGNINFYQNKANKANEYHKIVKDISDAIYYNQFIVYMQPKYKIDSEEIVGAEALVRWNHPKNGLLSPSVFLPLLEECQMITQVDMYVLARMCENMKNWIEQQRKVVPVSINLSAKHLEDKEFVGNLIRIVDSNHIPHELIELEFPECTVCEKQEILIEVMTKLAKLGFVLSVDNVGTGSAALHMLNQLPIQVIKIDKGLIKDLEDEEFSDKDRTIVMHIISYAKKKNLEVVAEGVETKGQRDLLLEQKCDVIQGFYYQKPMPSEEFEKLI